MKNKSLSPIVKASLKSNRLLSAMFCFFVVISFVLIFLAIGIIAPLGRNIETRINNHIENREIVIDISGIVSEEEKQRRLEEIADIPQVIDIYQITMSAFVEDESGTLGEGYEMNYLHKHYTPEIVSGRVFDESETSVALIPASFQDYNPQKGYLVQVDGTKLVGKTLELRDMADNVHKFEIIGTYNATDPIFSGKEILIPRAQLIEITDGIVKAFPERFQDEVSYMVVVDAPENRDAVYAKVEKITNSYTPKLNIDAETFNIAFAILLGTTVFFVLLTTFGFYMFLKGNINSRTNELALYKAIGYKPKDLYRIILGEHLVLTVLSIAMGVACYYLIVYFVVDPYLQSLLGGTFMEMQVSSNPLVAVALAADYALITLALSWVAVSRTEKIDLTVLLRE